MTSKIECKTIDKGIQAYYLVVGREKYYLFNQSYRKSNRDFFGNGRAISEALDFTNVRSYSVRRTIEKLKIYIPYIEKEYGLVVLNKTAKSKKKNYKRASYTGGYYGTNDECVLGYAYL